MNTLIKSALVIDPQSPHHGKTRDIHIRNGVISEIAARIDAPKASVIKGKGLHISPGWIDLRANFRDPGAEYKETFRSGSEAAKAGGFTRVVLMPSTAPAVDHKAGVEYVVSKNPQLPVHLYATCTLSAHHEGKQLSEMADMSAAGAIAFTDDKSPVSTELMSRALEYSRNLGGLVMTFPLDPGINPGAMMHEGPTSTAMGLKGTPALAEELRVHRDLELLKYSGGRLHISLISTAGSVELIRKAKKSGLQVTCAVAAHQLAFTDEDMIGFDSNLKVLPPFRSSADRKALIAGLKDGTIDAICSDHSPEDHEHKVLEWEYANYGMSSIQTAFHCALQSTEGKLDTAELIGKFTSGPARVLGVNMSVIREGEPAEITVFSTEERTHFTRTNWKSLSLNSPFLGKELKGRVHMI
ncbi:MAG: dihydroorotase [Flavobacteriales bacterium]|jgi:dihydroorotase